MPYSDFDIKKAQKCFQLEIIEKIGIFSHIEEVKISRHFAATLEENIPLAVSINTEKARSELIISDVLIEVRKIFNRKISFFPGLNLMLIRIKVLMGFVILL